MGVIVPLIREKKQEYTIRRRQTRDRGTWQKVGLKQQEPEEEED